MSETLAVIRGKVRGHIDEPAASYWSDAELNGLISDRQLDLWRRILQIQEDYFMSSFTLSTKVGQSRYNTADGMPTDIWRILTIRTTTSGREDLVWVPGNPTAPEWVFGLRSDSPVYTPYQIFYKLRNVNTLDVSPLPQEVVSANVDYVQLPTAVSSDSDTFLLPDPFLPYVQYAAAADALSKGPVGAPDVWAGKAEKAWEGIVLALNTPRSDQGPDVVEGMFQGQGS